MSSGQDVQCNSIQTILLIKIKSLNDGNERRHSTRIANKFVGSGNLTQSIASCIHRIFEKIWENSDRCLNDCADFESIHYWNENSEKDKDGKSDRKAQGKEDPTVRYELFSNVLTIRWTLSYQPKRYNSKSGQYFHPVLPFTFSWNLRQYFWRALNMKKAETNFTVIDYDKSHDCTQMRLYTKTTINE